MNEEVQELIGTLPSGIRLWRPVKAQRRGLITRIRQWLCPHEKRLDDLRRVAPDRVECPCLRCGKLLVAEYGIALPGRWGRR